jgi:hypothetical protein
LGEGDDDGLKDDKELSNKEIYNKDKEQGQNELARIHSPSCSSLLADTPSRIDGLGGGMAVEKNRRHPASRLARLAPQPQ